MSWTCSCRALIEREIRRRMQREGIPDLPLRLEERRCQRPTTERILRLFSPVERHRFYRGDRLIQPLDPHLTELHAEILRLLGVPTSVYRHSG